MADRPTPSAHETRERLERTNREGYSAAVADHERRRVAARRERRCAYPVEVSTVAAEEARVARTFYPQERK